MINVFWKKVCDSKGVTSSWEYEKCKKQIAELERKLNNSEEYVTVLEMHYQQTVPSSDSESLVCLRIKKNIERHKNNIEQFEREKQVLIERLKDMKLDFGGKDD